MASLMVAISLPGNALLLPNASCLASRGLLPYSCHRKGLANLLAWQVLATDFAIALPSFCHLTMASRWQKHWRLPWQKLDFCHLLAIYTWQVAWQNRGVELVVIATPSIHRCRIKRTRTQMFLVRRPQCAQEAMQMAQWRHSRGGRSSFSVLSACCSCRACCSPAWDRCENWWDRCTWRECSASASYCSLLR